MKENVLDVLMYLFETYVDAEDEPEPDQSELRSELSRAGFADAEIERALVWLDDLTGQQDSLPYGNQTAHGTRIYNDFEHERLDACCRGYITYLEQIGILSPPQRDHTKDNGQQHGGPEQKPEYEKKHAIAFRPAGISHSALFFLFLFEFILIFL